LKVIFAPRAAINPYQHILAQALKPFGIDVELRLTLPAFDQLLKRSRQIRILHLHWISPFYRGKRPWLRIVKFAVLLLVTRFSGHKIVWTAHNILPHQPTHPAIDMVGRFLITLLANAVIVHCEYAKLQIAKHYHRKRQVHVVAHGSYIGFYENKSTRLQARRLLGINNQSFVYLFFGRLLDYKRADFLINTFIHMNDENSQLLIAGQCPEDEQRRLEKLCSKHRRVRMDFGFISEDKVQLYFKTANVLVIPFSEVLTSGSIILGLSFGLPIIAPEHGCLPELINSQTGILFKDQDPEGLLHAMQSIQKMDLSNMGQAAYNCAEALDWAKIAHATRDLYSSLTHGV
jgi:glycosyltransferase involved in cell wall biosynthesis